MNQWSRQKFVPKRNRQVSGLKQQAGIRSRTKGTGRYKDQRPKEQRKDFRNNIFLNKFTNDSN